MRSYPGRENQVAEILIRTTYGLPKPGQQDVDPWWSRGWLERARDLVLDGWARIRSFARKALEVPEPPLSPEPPVVPQAEPLLDTAAILAAMTAEDWEELLSQEPRSRVAIPKGLPHAITHGPGGPPPPRETKEPPPTPPTPQQSPKGPGRSR